MRLAQIVRIVAAGCLMCGITAAEFGEVDIAGIDKVQPSLALVARDEDHIGTAFVIASDDSSSLLLTAAHNLGCDDHGRGCVSKMKVVLECDRATLDAERVFSGDTGGNGEADLALLRINRGHLATASLVPQGLRIRLSLKVAALGYTTSVVARLGNRWSMDARLARGEVIAVERGGELLDYDIPTRTGYSGAPVFEITTGYVIGVARQLKDGDYIGVGPHAISHFLQQAHQSRMPRTLPRCSAHTAIAPDMRPRVVADLESIERDVAQASRRPQSSAPSLDPEKFNRDLLFDAFETNFPFVAELRAPGGSSVLGNAFVVSMSDGGDYLISASETVCPGGRCAANAIAYFGSNVKTGYPVHIEKVMPPIALLRMNGSRNYLAFRPYAMVAPSAGASVAATFVGAASSAAQAAPGTAQGRILTSLAGGNYQTSLLAPRFAVGSPVYDTDGYLVGVVLGFGPDGKAIVGGGELVTKVLADRQLLPH